MSGALGVSSVFGAGSVAFGVSTVPFEGEGGTFVPPPVVEPRPDGPGDGFVVCFGGSHPTIMADRLKVISNEQNTGVLRIDLFPTITEVPSLPATHSKQVEDDISF